VLQLFRIATRNLARNRRRTALTLAALAVGVCAVVGVRGFLNGLQASLVQGVTEGTIGALQIHKHGFMASSDASPLTPHIAVDEALLAQVRAVEGVVDVTPRLSFAGMVSVGDETAFALMNGVDPRSELAVCPRRVDGIVRGAWLPRDDSVLMGLELARALKVAPGARGAVLSGDVDGVMNAVDIAVDGELAAATAGEKKLVVLPWRRAAELLRMPGKATELAVRVRDLDDVDDVAARLRAALGDAYEVHTWKDLARFAYDARETQNSVLGAITVLFLFIVLMGVTNSLLMSVMERVREIGTMMAVGARRAQILLLFLFEAVVLGAGGAAVGSALGAALILALGVRGVRLTTPGSSAPQLIVPFITPGFLLQMVLLCSVGAAAAALYPAWKASRMRPVEALASV
jgi:putative ABC transport system permease protein